MDINKYQENICNRLRNAHLFNESIEKRILTNRNKNSLKSFYNGLIKRKNRILELIQLSEKIGIAPELDKTRILKNIDTISSKIVLGEIEAKLPFNTARKTCVIRLAQTTVPKKIIQSLAKSKSIEEFDRIIEMIPPILLIKMGIFKTKHGDSYMIKSSIRSISTPMRD